MRTNNVNPVHKPLVRKERERVVLAEGTATKAVPHALTQHAWAPRKTGTPYLANSIYYYHIVSRYKTGLRLETNR